MALPHAAGVAITIFGIDMPEGGRSPSATSGKRPEGAYNVYHWLDPDERTLAYNGYANIADRTAITTTTIAWRDLVR